MSRNATWSTPPPSCIYLVFCLFTVKPNYPAAVSKDVNTSFNGRSDLPMLSVYPSSCTFLLKLVPVVWIFLFSDSHFQLNRMQARASPCLTPLLVSNVSEMFDPTRTVYFEFFMVILTSRVSFLGTLSSSRALYSSSLPILSCADLKSEKR